MTFKPPLAMLIFAMLSMHSIAQPMVDSGIIADVVMTRQTDSLKNLFNQDGFVMIKEATITMKSQYEKPIILPLTEGTWYRIIFVGDKSSKLYEVTMYDWQEKRVIYQKQRSKDKDGNIINYDYIPRFSEYHMIKPLQINHKKKDVNGHMILFKKIIKT
jgi:hypothetical protein